MKKQKYVLVSLIRGKPQKYHGGIVKKLAKEFKEPYLIDNPIPAHITLKYNIYTNKIIEIEKVLKEFSKRYKKQPIKIDGISNFHKKVIFLKVVFSKRAVKLFRNLNMSLNKIPWLEWHKFD